MWLICPPPGPCPFVVLQRRWEVAITHHTPRRVFLFLEASWQCDIYISYSWFGAFKYENNWSRFARQMTNEPLCSGQFFTAFIQVHHYGSTLPLPLPKWVDFPVSIWAGWLMRMPLGLNAFSVNSKVSFLDNFCNLIHWWKFRATTEIHRSTLDSHQSKWCLSGSLQISLSQKDASIFTTHILQFQTFTSDFQATIYCHQRNED